MIRALQPLVLLLAGYANPVFAADWPAFRGPANNGIAAPGESAPTRWGPEENNTESAVDVYTRTATYLLVDNRGQLIIPGCAPSEKPSEDHREKVRDFAMQLVG